VNGTPASRKYPPISLQFSRVAASTKMSLAATLRRTALALLHRTHLLAGFIGLAALLSLAPAAQAKDYCLFDQTVPSYVLVGRGFTIPLAGLVPLVTTSVK
jgi:hypothetical protein